MTWPWWALASVRWPVPVPVRVHRSMLPLLVDPRGGGRARALDQIAGEQQV